MLDVDTDSSLFTYKFRSSKWFILLAINLAVFTNAFQYGLIVPVLPFALSDCVNLPENEVQGWIGVLVGAYGAGVLIGSPIAGWLADRSSRRQMPYLLGLVASAASTVAFSLGRTTEILLLGRLMQGASSAVVHTVGMAILADTVGERDIGTAMGFVTLAMAAGVLVGPMAGGILYDQYGYAAVFISAYALIATDFVIRVLMVERPRASSKEAVSGIDVRSYGSMTNTSKNIPQMSENPELASRLDAEAPLLAKASIVHERNPRSFYHNLLILLSIPRMLASLFGAFIQTSILIGLESTVPLRIKTLFHYNSAHVAFIFLWITLPALVAPMVGHLSSRHGARFLVSLGFLCLAPCLALLRLIDHNDTTQVILLCFLLMLIGIAMHMIMTPLSAEAMRVVDEKENSQPGVFGPAGAYAQAFSLLNVAQASGSLVGPLAGSLLMERLGWNHVTLGSGVVSALCILPCFFALGGKRTGTHEEHMPAA